MAAGTTVSTWQAVVATRARAELAKKNTELATEQAKVQARFDTAAKAIETFHTGVSEEMLLKYPEFKDLRTKLLKEAAGFYAKLQKLLEGQTDVKSRRMPAILTSGWAPPSELKEPDFDALRDRDDFKKLSASAEANSGPITKPQG